jgi:DNA-binding transcriptional LysR family regulator
MTRRYTLRQLDTFLEVARSGSVSRAAEKLHVTQPAVSMQLRQLEESLGLSLIEVSGRTIRLTSTGREVERCAAIALARLKDLDDLAAAHRGLKAGRVDLAVVSTTKYFMPMLLMRFSKRFPDIEIALHIHNRESMTRLLERNEVDLVIMGRAPEGIDCCSAEFATNPMAVVSAPDHPLSRRRGVSMQVLDGQDFVVREQGSGTRSTMEQVFAAHGVKPHIVMEMPSNETIKQAVMAGMGLSFLSLRTVRHELASGHIVLLDIEGLPVIRQWYVTHLEARRLSPAAEALRSFLIEEAAGLVKAWA